MKEQNRNIIKIPIIILVVIIIASSFCGCLEQEQPKEKIYETGYFRYTICKYSDTEYVRIKGLTKLGKQQEYIVIPEEIDGKQVREWNGFDYVPNLKALYISYCIDFINISGWELNPSGNKMFSSEENYNIFYLGSKHRKAANFAIGGYISTIAIDDYAKKIPCWDQKYIVANMQYLFNYIASPNMGVHFIDNTEVGAKVNVIPITPQRDGYTFTGWYSEQECINEINLESYVKKDEEILYLYAGWQEIKN